MGRPESATKLLITGNAGAIEAVAHLPAAGPPRAVAVVAHPHPLFGGSMDNKVVTSVARVFADAGAATWRFNFRGVGKSEGAHDNGQGETGDMLKVIEQARALNPGLPLWLSGFSFGGAVAFAASESVDASEVILIAPAFRRLADKQDASRVAGIAGRVLVIHGEKDETVPLGESLNWARPRDIPVVVVPGADHFFHLRLHIIKQIAARWLTAPG